MPTINNDTKKDDNVNKSINKSLKKEKNLKNSEIIEKKTTAIDNSTNTRNKILSNKRLNSRSLNAKKTLSNVNTKKENYNVSITDNNKVIYFFKKFIFIWNLFKDIYLLLKNFINWNFSKILIYLYSIILWIILCLPLVLIFYIYSKFSKEVDISMLLNWQFSLNIFSDLLLIFIFFIFIISYLYWNILLINLYNSYLDNKKLKINENDYLNIKKIFLYFKITLFNILIFLVPFLLITFLIFILFFLFREKSSNLLLLYLTDSNFYMNPFFIFTFIVMIFILIFYLFLFYKTIFSYFILSDLKYKNKNLSAFLYIKESYLRTKGFKNFLKFISLIFIFLIITLPIRFIWLYINETNKDLNYYIEYIKLTDIEKKEVLEQREVYTKNLLEKYEQYDDLFIWQKYKTYQFYNLLFSIFNFLILNGVFIMICAWFYKRELK